MMSYPKFLTFDDVLILPAKGKRFDPKKGNTESKITRKLKIKVPIISTGMPTVTESKMAILLAKLGGVGVIHPFISLDDYGKEINKVKSKNLVVGAAVADGDFERALVAIKSHADFITIDAGQGYNTESQNFIKKLKNKYPKSQIMAGCYATPRGVGEAIKSGADSVRVGIGPGSHCTTRVVAGVGAPQLSAVVECSNIARKNKVPIISDGGIRYPGDVTKAIAAGASAVMIGGLFCGTDESPGEIIQENGIKYKKTWGYSTNKADEMAEQRYRDLSIKHLVKKYIKKNLGLGKKKKRVNKKIIEGVEEARTPYKGSAEKVFLSLVDGLKLGMAYCGAENINELQKKATFIEISKAGLQEGFPHDDITK